MCLSEELALDQSKIRGGNLAKALSILDERERKAIFLRFWKPCSILEISKAIQMNWEDTDRFIETTLQKLRQEILKLENRMEKSWPHLKN